MGSPISSIMTNYNQNARIYALKIGMHGGSHVSPFQDPWPSVSCDGSGDPDAKYQIWICHILHMWIHIYQWTWLNMYSYHTNILPWLSWYLYPGIQTEYDHGWWPFTIDNVIHYPVLLIITGWLNEQCLWLWLYANNAIELFISIDTKNGVNSQWYPCWYQCNHSSMYIDIDMYTKV